MNHSPNIHAHTKAHILKTGRMARSTQGFRLTRRTSHRDARPLFNGVRDERLMRTDSICDLWSKSDPWAAHYSPGGLWWTCMCVRVWECELMPLSGSDLSYLCIFSFLWKRKCSLSCRDSHSAFRQTVFKWSITPQKTVGPTKFVVNCCCEYLLTLLLTSWVMNTMF